MILLDDITVEIAGATLVRGVTTAARPGQFTAVVGANGAGKTTLLRDEARRPDRRRRDRLC